MTNSPYAVTVSPICIGLVGLAIQVAVMASAAAQSPQASGGRGELVPL